MKAKPFNWDRYMSLSRKARRQYLRTCSNQANEHLLTERRAEEAAMARVKVAEQTKGPRPRSGRGWTLPWKESQGRRCDTCDYLVSQRRVRVWVTLDVPPSAGMLVCPECATYLVEKGIAMRVPRTIRPRGVRKAGAGEFARCSRFAD